MTIFGCYMCVITKNPLIHWFYFCSAILLLLLWTNPNEIWFMVFFLPLCLQNGRKYYREMCNQSDQQTQREWGRRRKSVETIPIQFNLTMLWLFFFLIFIMYSHFKYFAMSKTGTHIAYKEANQSKKKKYVKIFNTQYST